MCLVASPLASGEDASHETSPPIVCDAAGVDCGPPVCPKAIKAVRARKAELADARHGGSPSKVRKAKRRVAKAKRKRREACEGFVL
jgi:hypothetical protein